MVAENCTHVYHLFVIRCPDREVVIKSLESKGIQTLIHYPVPPHFQKAYSGFPGKYPISEKIHSEILSLPIWPGLDVEKLAAIND